MKVVALEEHYWDAEVAKHFAERGPEMRNPQMLERLHDLGALRLKEMDQAGIDVQVLSHGAPATQRMDGDLAVQVARGRIAERITNEDQLRLVDRYLQQVKR